MKNQLYSAGGKIWTNAKVAKSKMRSKPVYTGESSYIYSVKWMDFEKDMNKYIDKSISVNERINEYDISKEIRQ